MILLEGALDYAGLFPPASLDTADAVRRYAGYRRGADRALLGRFVVPIAKLSELARAAEPLLAFDPEGVWEVSVIGGGEPRDDTQRVADVEARHGGGGPSLWVRSIERRIESAAEIRRVVGGHHDGGGRSLYLELPPSGADLRGMIAAVADAGAHAKLRTGGTTPGAFPSADAVARFVAACAQAGVAFKATAGLHHALRGEHPLDGPQSARATMHGFLNLFVGAVLLDAGQIGEAELRTVLEEHAPDVFDVESDTVRWRDHEAGADEIRRARTRLLHSFGTCSFEEPVQELRRMGALVR